MSQPFHVGQRVRLRSVAYTIPQGSIGTIVSIHQPFYGLYEVQFDGDTNTHLIYGIHLESVEADTKH